MRKALLAIFIVICLSGLSFGQAATSTCPTIEVIGPAGVTNPDEEMTFVASVSTSGPEITFRWTLEQGTITEGQGTPIIKVKGITDGVTVTATVTVEGLPNACKNTASESGPVAPKMELESLDSWGTRTNDETRASLDIFFYELANNPDQIGLIVLSVLQKERIDRRNKRLKLIVNHANFRKFDLGRIEFRLHRSPVAQTTVYRIYQGFDFPCNGCVEIEGRNLK